MDELTRFLKYVSPLPLGSCWAWVGGFKGGGYGAFAMWSRGVVSERAHRASFIIFRGEIPAGLCVLHHCDHRWCVNPQHLFLGTLADNVHDMFAKGRRPPVLGTQNGRSKLTTAQVEELRQKYATRKFRQADLAEEYGVVQCHVSRLVRLANRKAG